MFQNHTIARIAGIPIRANLLLGYLLAFWLILGASSGRASETFLLVTMSTVLLLAHELGHAMVARRFGLEVVDIVLWPLGGMARISDMPESPRVEAWVAAAGPLVNLALALIALPFALIYSGGDGPTRELFGLQFNLPTGALSLFVAINVAYGVFNLVPAFPMDGGRLLRAFLARGDRSWVEATNRATRVGSILAWAGIFFALWHTNLILAIICFFVLWAGLRERWSVRLKHHAEAFGGGGKGRLAGWEELLRQRGAMPNGMPDGMRGEPATGRDPERAADKDPIAPPRPSGQGGFSDDDIQQLESFRGRIQRRTANQNDADTNPDAS